MKRVLFKILHPLLALFSLGSWAAFGLIRRWVS